MDTLTEYMSMEADITLCFDDQELPGHSQLLILWSNVLRGAVLAARGSVLSHATIRVPMTGTASSDWLKVAAFMYPSGAPRPEVTWDNLEALLVLADKYDIPAIASMASEFLKVCGGFSSNSKNQHYIWKWLPILDRMAGSHKELLEDAIQKTAASHKLTCTPENVQSLSQQSIVLLTCALAGTWPEVKHFTFGPVPAGSLFGPQPT